MRDLKKKIDTVPSIKNNLSKKEKICDYRNCTNCLLDIIFQHFGINGDQNLFHSTLNVFDVRHSKRNTNVDDEK